MLKTLLLLVAGHVFAVRGECHPGWFLFEEMCYGFGHSFEGWGEAMAICQAYGGTLAEPRTPTVNTWLKGEMKNMKLPNAWLGATDVFHEGTWEWVSDQVTVGPFTDWSSGEPDQLSGEDCMEIRSAFNYQWNDNRCDSLQGFVCQMEPREPIIG